MEEDFFILVQTPLTTPNFSDKSSFLLAPYYPMSLLVVAHRGPGRGRAGTGPKGPSPTLEAEGRRRLILNGLAES